jgi:hypothetical protein
MAVFNDTTTKKGLIQACEDYCNLGDAGISGSTSKLHSFTRWINDGGRAIWEIIIRSSNDWIYDDSNQTDLPQASTDLVSGTGKYSTPTTALRIRRVEIKDSADNWRVIPPYALENLEWAVDEFAKTNGDPMTYRLVGTTIELKPAPNYNKTGGLKIYFDREGVSFVYTDTTAVAGFASIFHDLLAQYASIQWLKIKDPTNPTLALLMRDWEKATTRGGTLESFQMKKLPAKKDRISRKKQNYK